MNNIAFLVLSCDKYSDLWEPYNKLFNKYWADCPFDKYFASNENPFPCSEFHPILIGKDITWSQGLYNSLLFLESQYEYVLITLEDLFLIDKVDTDKLLKTINSFICYNGNYLRLHTKRKYNTPFNQYFGILEKNTPYRQNCVYSLWNIKNLKTIININENAWEFEKKGVIRGYVYDGFYCSSINHFKISNTIVKGKWIQSELNTIKSLIPDITVHRPVLSKKKSNLIKIQTFWFNLFFKYIPWKIQNYLYQFIKFN